MLAPPLGSMHLDTAIRPTRDYDLIAVNQSHLLAESVGNGNPTLGIYGMSELTDTDRLTVIHLCAPLFHTKVNLCTYS